jgi:plasmid maintenance system antidote protein VapI
MESTDITYNVALMRRDLAERGWMPTDLAKKAKVPDITVSRFLRGQYQTPRMAKRLARALGYKTPKRYVLVSGQAVA